MVVGIFRFVVVCGIAVVAGSRLEAWFMAAPVVISRSVPVLPYERQSAAVLRHRFSHRLMTLLTRGRFIPAALSLRVVRPGRMGLVHAGRRAFLALTSVIAPERAGVLSA
ncbi:hypothetical protein GCM10010344_10770 [Streptomyces bluensis]|nr:hypothetical protein GCM10010344_10770 [Streptomyces bluensis]